MTLNCDSLGAKPLRTSPAAELQPGTLIQGTPYVAVYNNSDGVFYLQGFYGNPYNIPLGGMLDYTTLSVPNSSFVFPVGQALSRTVYAALFAAYSTYYGAGDGTTTFNIIDMRGRVGIAPDGGAGRMAGVGLNGAGGVNGAVQALAATNLPPHIHSGQTGGQSNDHTHTSTTGVRVGGNFFPGGNGYDVGQQGETSSGSSQDHSHAFTTNGGAGLNGTAFSVAMPYVGVNKILRVI